MSRSLLLCRYLMMIRTSQHWIPKQSHLWWVSIAAPWSRRTRKQPHPVKNLLSLSVPSCVHCIKSTKKARRPCFLTKWLQQDHLCSLLTRTSSISVTQPRSNRWPANQSNYNCSEGNWYVSYALASVDVLFTGGEMARCNGSGNKGFHWFDSGKLGFLVSVLQRKFDSPFLVSSGIRLPPRINTKCRGKRRTLIHILKKTNLFRKHKDGTISLSFPKKNYGSANWVSHFQQNFVLIYFKLANLSI